MPGLLKALHEKFGRNLRSLNTEVVEVLDNIDTDLRLLARLAEFLEIDINSGDLHRQGGASLLREAFSDLSQAMYLQCIGLVVPGRMSTRRAFELGIASVYIWDLPHAYWGWIKCDADFSFSEMIAHLSSEPYMELLRSQQGASAAAPLSIKECQKLYRQLSNTVHGKHSDLPMLSPARFDAEKTKTIKELGDIQTVLKMITAAWSSRVPTFRAS
ncbi:hypothetical protein [Methylobacterium sp. Leaf106]|uniref:hypothetical protein n=1 Tax=Methylobacterium sp. Leaf106 TaxID=1736255 RepID=UPI0012E84567|nr:hypothetical protein [Methylobacterium sp. Leaf106]